MGPLRFDRYALYRHLGSLTGRGTGVGLHAGILESSKALLSVGSIAPIPIQKEARCIDIFTFYGGDYDKQGSENAAYSFFCCTSVGCCTNRPD